MRVTKEITETIHILLKQLGFQTYGVFATDDYNEGLLVLGGNAEDAILGISAMIEFLSEETGMPQANIIYHIIKHCKKHEEEAMKKTPEEKEEQNEELQKENVNKERRRTMNSVVLIGHIGTKPEFVRKNERLCCTFYLDVQRRIPKQTLKQKSHIRRYAQTIDSIPIVLWDEEAQFARRHFVTDDYEKHLVMITGEIHIQYSMHIFTNYRRLHWTPKVVGDNIVIVG